MILTSLGREVVAILYIKQIRSGTCNRKKETDIEDFILFLFSLLFYNNFTSHSFHFWLPNFREQLPRNLFIYTKIMKNSSNIIFKYDFSLEALGAKKFKLFSIYLTL